jgi:signal transduction histidine kinase/PAS domain-containing protein
MRVAKTGWRAWIVRRFHAATGLSCPICLLAVVVAVALGSIATRSILIDPPRAALIGGSALIVIAFIILSVIAVNRCARREARRLDRLSAMASPHPAAGRDALLGRLVSVACDLVGCEAVPRDDDRQPEDPPPDERLTLSVRRADLVWIGPIALRRLHGGGFSVGDLAFLRVLARIADGELRQTEALQATAEETSRHRDEAQRWRQSIDTLLAEMSDAMFTLDAEWRFVASNRNADALFGEYPEDFRNRPIWDMFPELAGSEFDSECRRAVREQHAVAFSLHWMRGDKWLLVRAFPRPAGPSKPLEVRGQINPRQDCAAWTSPNQMLSQAAQPCLAVYMQDISRQVAADENLRQAAKMEAIGRLTGGIAHDFNNLLTVILGNTEILELDLPEHGELREVHDQIKRAAQNAAELTHQLLAFGRRQPLSPSDVDVGRLTVGLDGLLRRTLGPQITVEIKCLPVLWQARVDSTQLENAIINLALNARDAMPSGGRLTIETANLTLRRPEIDALGEIRAGKYVVISVSDTGTGIPRDVLGKVFEPFFSTKPPGHGTGLGLSMIYGFVTQSGGHARISSEVGRGTTVRLYLPSAGQRDGAGAQDKLAAAGQARPAAPSLPGGPERILVVEDAEMVRDYAQSVLAGLGYSVSVAADGAQALALLDGGLQPDLLLTDILLPNGMDGLAVAEQVKLRRPGIPVLYMSGYVENVGAAQQHLDPQTNLLLKPFRRVALAAMVRARLDRGRGA